jgi:hypothetical protein
VRLTLRVPSYTRRAPSTIRDVADLVSCYLLRGWKHWLSQRGAEPRLLILELFLRFWEFTRAYGHRASR